MAGVRFKASTSVPVVTGTSLITLLQIKAASNHRVLIDEWSVSFTGISNTGVPILVQVVRQTTAGTFSNTANCKKDPDTGSETLQTTAKDTASAEPTTTDVLDTLYVHPQTGYTWPNPGKGKEIVVAGGEYLAIIVTAAASVSAQATFKGEE